MSFRSGRGHRCAWLCLAVVVAGPSWLSFSSKMTEFHKVLQLPGSSPNTPLGQHTELRRDNGDRARTDQRFYFPGGSTKALLGFSAVWASSRMSTASESHPGGTSLKRSARIDAFDTVRFLLVLYIVCGHFVAFSVASPFAFRAMTQVNVAVGAFFALSGYVAAHTGGSQDVDAVDFIQSRIFGYVVPHLVVLALFSPMFIYVDFTYNGATVTAWHAILSITMASAWFPLRAEVWNAPTWFLGALTLSTVLTPSMLRVVGRQNATQLRRSAAWLTVLSLLPKLVYCHVAGGWHFLEGAIPNHPNLMLFNIVRFNPVCSVPEVMLGMVACHLVKLDEGTDCKVRVFDSTVVLALMVGVFVARAQGILALSDMLVRTCLFLPLFLWFLMAVHRASIASRVLDPVVRVLTFRPLVSLGQLAFPIFVVHGPIGQLFYKRLVARTLFGGTMDFVCGTWFFWLYMSIVMCSACVLNVWVVKNESIRSRSRAVQQWISRMRQSRARTAYV